MKELIWDQGKEVQKDEQATTCLSTFMNRAEKMADIAYCIVYTVGLYSAAWAKLVLSSSVNRAHGGLCFECGCVELPCGACQMWEHSLHASPEFVWRVIESWLALCGLAASLQESVWVRRSLTRPVLLKPGNKSHNTTYYNHTTVEGESAPAEKWPFMQSSKISSK